MQRPSEHHAAEVEALLVAPSLLTRCDRAPCHTVGVLERPETRFALTAQGQSIAFQVCGHGELDLVYVPNWASPIDLIWDHPAPARFLARLATFSRLILFDKRGSGSSDNVTLDALATLEDWTDDIVTVMDAVGSRQAVLAGAIVGSPIAVLFAATHPDRTSALVLINATARLLADRDYAGIPSEGLEERVAAFRAMWGTEAVVRLLAPSMAGDEAFCTWLARFCRVGNPPAMATAVFRAQLLSDVRPALELIQAPTLIMQRAEAEIVSSQSQGRYLAEHIAGARYVEVPGNDPLPYVGEAAALLDEIEAFLTGHRPEILGDRVLATVLFTDIVASTEHAARRGDHYWAEVLNEHDLIVARELERHRGRKVNPTGDGILATFDGPARAVRCAQAICSSVRSLGIEVRAGVHTGEVERRGDDIGGIAVHIGQRVCALAQPGEVLTTTTVRDLVTGSGIDFNDRGCHTLKGVPGEWALLAVGV